MTIAAITTDEVEYSQDFTNATAVATAINALITAVNAGTQVVNSLSADGPGRGIIAAGYFDAATVALKFAAGAFAANSTIRALFAAGLIDSATATSIIAAGAIPASKMASVAAPDTKSGTGVTLDPTKAQTNYTTTAGGNTASLANGTYAGQKVVVFHAVKGSSGTVVITPATFDHTSVTLTDVYASVEFIWTGTTWTMGRLVGSGVTVTG